MVSGGWETKQHVQMEPSLSAVAGIQSNTSREPSCSEAAGKHVQPEPLWSAASRIQGNQSNACYIASPAMPV